MHNVGFSIYKSLCPITSRSFATTVHSFTTSSAPLTRLQPITALFNARHFYSGTSRTPSSDNHVITPLTSWGLPSTTPTQRPNTRPFSSTPACLIKRPARKTSASKTATARPQRTSYAGRQVPIPFGNISKKDLDTIFHHSMIYEEGNKMLQILHSRRVTGALVDQGIYIAGTHTVPEEALRSALEWLRAKYPVDEQSAADMWAQQEAEKLEESYIARAERIGLYKKVEDPSEISTRNVYGTDSVIDDFKRYHEERRKKEAEEKQKSGVTQQEQELRLARRDEREKEKEVRARVQAEKNEKRALAGMATVGQEHVPELTTVQRLYPSTALGLALMALAVAYGWLYEPVPKSARLFPDVPTAVATIGALATPMLAILLIWRFPSTWRFMNSWFMQTPAYPRAIGVITNIFTHTKVTHIATNLATLWFFGVQGKQAISFPFCRLFLEG